jgi:hypothetical protein
LKKKKKKMQRGLLCMGLIVLVFSCHVHHCWCWVDKLQSYKHEEKTSTLAIHTNNHGLILARALFGVQEHNFNEKDYKKMQQHNLYILILFDMDSAYRHSGTKWGASKNETTSRVCVATPPLLVRFKSSVLLFLGEP